MNFKCIAACFLIIFMASDGYAQTRETKNIILVTLDGLRWQELFRGADPSIVQRKKYVQDQSEIQAFLHGRRNERKKSLMSFMWEVVATEGQLYGNRDIKNKVNCTNHHLISYPG